MVNNLFIARKSYRPREGVGMFIIKKMYIFERYILIINMPTPSLYVFLAIYIYIYIYIYISTPPLG